MLDKGEVDSDYDSEEDDFEEVDKYGVKRVRPDKPIKEREQQQKTDQQPAAPKRSAFSAFLGGFSKNGNLKGKQQIKKDSSPVKTASVVDESLPGNDSDYYDEEEYKAGS